MRFRSGTNGPEVKIDVGPEQAHDFLFAEPGHQELGGQGAVPRACSPQKLRQVLFAIFSGERGNALGKLQATDDPAAAVAFEELGDHDGVMENCVGAELVIPFSS